MSEVVMMSASIMKSTVANESNNQRRPIYRIHKDTGEHLATYASIKDASDWVVENHLAADINSARTGIIATLKGTYKTSHTFKWEYVPQTAAEAGEIWKPVIIDGAPMDGYSVSSLGRFRNNKGVIRDDYKPHHTGYINVHIGDKKYVLHRLVAQAFVENPENKTIIVHKDGDNLNNRADNLAWATVAENNQQSRASGAVKAYTRKIIQYDLGMRELARFDSIVEAAEKIGIPSSGIKAVLYNKQTTTHDFIFRYNDAEK